MDICRNKRTQEHYIIIEENNEDMLHLVTPKGEMKNNFWRDAFEDPIYYDEAIMNLGDFITDEQLSNYKEYLLDEIRSHLDFGEDSGPDKRNEDVGAASEEISIEELERIRKIIKSAIHEIRVKNLRLSSLRRRRR